MRRKSVYSEQVVIETILKTIELGKVSGKHDSVLELPLKGVYEFLDANLFILFKDQNGN